MVSVFLIYIYIYHICPSEFFFRNLLPLPLPTAGLPAIMKTSITEARCQNKNMHFNCYAPPTAPLL